jgi:hypothetical protein
MEDIVRVEIKILTVINIGKNNFKVSKNKNNF